MDEFIEFLKVNWIELSVVLMAFISLLVALFRKKAKFVIPEEDLKEVYYLLPDWINEAEQTGLEGNRKLRFVIDKAVEYLHQRLGTDKKSIYGIYTWTIEFLVEKILSTPTKKG